MITSTESSLTDPTEFDEDFYVGEGAFQLPNGDKYEGGYIAHRSGLVWKEGKSEDTHLKIL